MSRKLTIAVWMARIFLGVTFLVYGWIKITGQQFIYDAFVFDSRTGNPMTLVWSFFGYSRIYGTFIGVMEMLAGILILIPRTSTLGAMVLFPIAANISIMDLCFGFPLPATSLVIFSTLLCGWLLFLERKRLIRIIFDKD